MNVSEPVATDEVLSCDVAVVGAGPAGLMVAEQLAQHTSLGAAHMAVSSGIDAAELRRRVTSPAGTTEAAIKSFQADGFEAIVEKALSAAAHRSAEMAEQLGQ